MKSKLLLKTLVLSGVMALASPAFAQSSNGEGGHSSSSDAGGFSGGGGAGQGPEMFRDIRTREAVQYLTQRYGPIKEWACDKGRAGSGVALTEIGVGRPTNPEHGINRMRERQ